MLNRIRRLLGRPEERREPHVQFLGEQDGPAERELKASVCALLERRSLIERAYLARVVYAGVDAEAVALCLLGPEDADLVAAIGAEFARRFSTGLPLDIFFVSRAQDAALGQVCRPFFTGASNASGTLEAG